MCFCWVLVISTTRNASVFLLWPLTKPQLEKSSSTTKVLQTPKSRHSLRDLVINELKRDPELRWEETTKPIEEKEHSLEMHLPYIRKLFGTNFKLIPIMVGSTSPEQEKAYGKYLARYFDRDDSFFVVSSDFCHWGDKYSF